MRTRHSLGIFVNNAIGKFDINKANGSKRKRAVWKNAEFEKPDIYKVNGNKKELYGKMQNLRNLTYIK